MPILRRSARSDFRVLLPVATGALLTLLALVGGDGPGGAPTGWYAAFFGLTTALTAPALFRRRWPQRLALAIGGLLQIFAGLVLILAGVGLVLIAGGLLALWAAASRATTVRSRSRGEGAA